MNDNDADAPMRLGTKRKTFSEYVWAVARSTASFASTTSTLARLCLRRGLSGLAMGGGRGEK